MKKNTQLNITFLCDTYSLLISVVLFIAFFVIGNSSVNAQCLFTIKGLVIDSSENTPLELSYVQLEENKKGTYTNKRGEFQINDVCAGEYDIHISHLQCEHLHIKLNITKDTFIVVYIKHTDIELQGGKITMHTHHEDDDFNSLNLTEINAKKGQSIADMMSGIAGVVLVKSGSTIAKPMVNGLVGNRVILVNNDVRQEGQNWGLDHAPEIDGNMATEIVLIKGADALRYASDGIGGVVLVNPQSIFKERTNQLKGNINSSAQSNGRGMSTSIQLGQKVSLKFPLFWRVYGTLAQSGNIKTPDYYLNNTGKRENNAAAMLAYQTTKVKLDLFYSFFNNKIAIYQGAHIGNLTDLKLAINRDEPTDKGFFTYDINRPFQAISHHLLKKKWNFLFNANNKLEWIVSYQQNHRQEFDILRSANSSNTAASFDYLIKSTMTDLVWSKKDFHHVNFKLGVYGLHQTNAFSGRFVIPGFVHNSGAAYFITEWDIKKVHFEAAVRNDVKSIRAYLWNQGVQTIKDLFFNGFTYHTQMKAPLTKQSFITLTQASSWRPPMPNELYINGLHQGLATIEVGDPNLKPERSFNQQISYHYHSKKIQFEAELYYKRINNFINLVPDTQAQLTIRGAFPVFKYEQYDAEIYGVNTLLKVELSQNLALNNQTFLLYGNQLSPSRFLNQMPPMSNRFSLEYKVKKWVIKPQMLYTAQQKRLLPEMDFKEPPASYFRFDANLEYEFVVHKQVFQIQLTVINITNTRYRDYLNRFRYFVDEPGRNFIVKLNIPLNIKTQKK
jgi:iron complex outermembrane recepter protein